MPTYALLGYPLTHSFSRTYFTKKFASLGLADTHRYVNFELQSVNQLEEKLDEYNDVAGFNVTIPHKRAILSLLDAIDPIAASIGAVNTVIVHDGRLTGYNTDYLGFRDDLLEQLAARGRNLPTESKALILGTGGASLAVAAALDDLGIEHSFVSRSAGANRLTYDALSGEVLQQCRLLVNTTPLGMYPNVSAAPYLDYGALTAEHFCYDLTYNPPETAFMRRARAAGAGAANGQGMLVKQAEAAWKIWTAE
ncbi:Shikimate dehydrogenase (NADP(+)) [Neolewinella maritima]|uniref:Shikimate dehydrogenase (NADP(+)) n=1 Tax=Neolewinella maritima TaxID=1383882 RepID=A0ABM9AZK4_9BACT|nr:shikimate dehydrogenase [Neolewinella maritima]CAH1000082.1 Shikimate dehydrogenase (NADP(+)) [Neolewinella maritima]